MLGRMSEHVFNSELAILNRIGCFGNRIVQCRCLMHSPGLHSILQQVYCIEIWPQHSRSSCRWTGQPRPNCPSLEGVHNNHLPNEPSSGLVADLGAMGQVEPNLDLLIAIQVQRELVGVED